MSSQPTPTYNFSGIDYNSSFFNKVKTSSSGLTQTQANALYLQKTVADTATSLETFSGGISANTLTTTSLTVSGANSFVTQVSTDNSTSASTTAFVKTAINALSSIYQTAAQVTTAITSYGYQTAAQVTTAITSYGYQTASQVSTSTSSALTTFLTATNSWTGSNTFATLIASSLKTPTIDTSTAGILVIGGTTATSISLGSALIPTNILGALTVTGNEIESGTLTSTGMFTASGGIAMGSLKTIALGFVAVDTTVLNTTYTTATGSVPNFNYIGSTAFIYQSANSANIAQTTNTIIYSTTVSLTGIYNISYCTRFSGSGTTAVVQGAQAWIYVSSPALYGGLTYGQLALTLVGYASPYLNLSTVGLATTASWTGLVNAGATVSIQVYLQYSAGNYTGFVLGGATNYLTLTRIA